MRCCVPPACLRRLFRDLKRLSLLMACWLVVVIGIMVEIGVFANTTFVAWGPRPTLSFLHVPIDTPYKYSILLVMIMIHTFISDFISDGLVPQVEHLTNFLNSGITSGKGGTMGEGTYFASDFINKIGIKSTGKYVSSQYGDNILTAMLSPESNIIRKDALFDIASTKFGRQSVGNVNYGEFAKSLGYDAIYNTNTGEFHLVNQCNAYLSYN